MQSSTAKKVVVSRFDRESILGFVHPVSYLQPEFVEILLVNGVLQQIPYPAIKQVAFVKDFDTARGQLDQKVFQSRPKHDGLWVRLGFRDGEVQEGVLVNNLAALDSHGFLLIPPNSAGNVQRMFVPKAALSSVTVLAVMGLRATKRAKPKTVADGQQSLFEV